MEWILTWLSGIRMGQVGVHEGGQYYIAGPWIISYGTVNVGFRFYFIPSEIQINTFVIEQAGRNYRRNVTFPKVGNKIRINQKEIKA
jgi:hypothetical protein